ncbi:MAG TPA: hypothetical protein VFF04_04895 [Candidatus Babeliales bacterium]|nr:hypothetical protein [Candidatus Babeliales bacterium]
MNKNGSAIIVVVVITACIMFMLLHANQVAICSTSIAIKRLHYEQRFRSVQGLLTVVCALCKGHWEALSQHAPHHWVTEFPGWPCGDQHSDYNGQAIVISDNESSMKITVSLLDKQKIPVVTMRCILERTAPDKIMIHSWITDEAN